VSASDVKVVPAGRLDALRCLALRRDVIGEGRWFITTSAELTTNVDEEERRILAAREDPRSLYLVARRPGARVAGLLTASVGPLARMAHAAKLEVMVASAQRGHGVGSALLSACCRWADDHEEITKLGLTVFADNERALALYARHGFREEGRREREYRLADGSFRDDVLLYRFCPPDPRR